MMTTLPNVLLNQNNASITKGSHIAINAPGDMRNFLTLLNQALSDGQNLTENPLLQLLPTQINNGTLPETGQLTNADITDLSQWITQLQTLVLAETNLISQSTRSLKASNQAVTDKTLSDNASTDMSALSALLAMLPASLKEISPSIATNSYSRNASVSGTDSNASQLAPLAQHPGTPAPHELTELASQRTILQSVTFADDDKHSIATDSLANHLKGNPEKSVHSSLTLSTENNQNVISQPTTFNSASNTKDQTENTIIPIKATASANGFETATPPSATVTTYNIAATHSATNNPSLASTPANHNPLIQQPIGSPLWQQAIGQQITLFSRRGQHSAELRLHPAELGSVKISLKLEDGLAQLSMISAHSHVRAALEAALPVLRAQLAENGIQLGQSNISNDHFAGHQNGQNHQPFSHMEADDNGLHFTPSKADTLDTPTSLALLARGDNAVDTFV